MTPRRVWLLLAAFLMAFPAASVGQAELPTDRAALPETSPPVPSPATEPSEALGRLGALLGLPGLDAAALVRSPTLGFDLPAATLVDHYAAEAAASPTPLRQAILLWNAALELEDGTALAQDPRLAQADALPLDLQRALAVLLHALTDATLLQRDAVTDLRPAEYARLLEGPEDVLAGVFDDGAVGAEDALAELAAAAARVDTGAIRSATQIVTAATQSVLPALREAARAPPAPAAAPQHPLLQGFAATHDADAVAAGGLPASMSAAADALRIAVQLSAGSVPEAAPAREPHATHPLAAAVLEWAALRGLSWGEVAPQLAQADGLPIPLQDALARILLAGADWERAVASSGEPAQRQAGIVAAQITLLEAVARSAPTVQAWGLVWSHGGAALLPATPAHLAQAGSDLSRTASDAAFGDLDAALALGRPGLQRTSAPAVAVGPLGDGIVAIHTLLGGAPDAAAAAEWRAGADALPAAVQRTAAGIVWAEVAAITAIRDLETSLTDEERALLAAPIDADLFTREVSAQEASDLAAYFAVADRVQTVHLDAAAGIAAAVRQASQELSSTARDGFTDAVAKPEARKGWFGRLGDSIAGFEVIGTAKAQAVPATPTQAPTPPTIPNTVCPTRETLAGPTVDCANDLWFKSTLVLISGPASSTYPMTSQAPTGKYQLRGTVLNLDLGGDDIYRNNAGGAGHSFGVGTVDYWWVDSPNDSPPVAVSLDLRGNDMYLPPVSGQGEPDALQGAGLGGIGMLVDLEGNDRYVARAMSQGFGRGSVYDPSSPAASCGLTCNSGPGIGFLLDAAGNDHYQAAHSSQGAAQVTVYHSVDSTQQGRRVQLSVDGMPPVGALIDRSGNDEYRLTPALTATLGQGGGDGGIAMLVDAEGDDVYRNGRQGSSRRHGVGILVDLAGTDTYTRKPASTFGDGSCWASQRSPHGAALDASTASSPVLTDAQAIVDGEHGFFLDGGPATCMAALDSLRPAVLPAPEDAAEDADADGWFDFLERIDLLSQGGTDPADAGDRPAGLPAAAANCRVLVLPQFAGPCDALPAEDADEGPYQSAYLLRIPGVLALGDAVANLHPATSAAGPGRDYGALLDLGGADTYRNRMGGAPAALPAPARLHPEVALALAASVPNPQASLLQTLGIDFGGDDEYRSAESCVQGCNGVLLDLAGDDRYLAEHKGVGGCPCMAHGGAVAAPAGTSALLVDVEGDDEYRIESLNPDPTRGDFGQGSVKDTASGIGLLLDAAGSDRYRGTGQGHVDWTDLALKPSMYSNGQADRPVGVLPSAGLFFDVGGADQYSPVGRQGTADSNSAAPPVTPPAAAPVAPVKVDGGHGLFYDGRGRDLYVGTPANPQGTDFSGFLNDRVRLTQAGAVTTTFWDQDKVGPSPDPVGGDPVSDPGGALDLVTLGIAIGTRADEAYTSNYALLYDPGGNDLYHNNAGSTMLRAQVGDVAGAREIVLDPSDAFPVASVLIDAAGDDDYLAPEAPGLVPSGQVDVNSVTRGNLSSMVPMTSGILAQGSGVLGVGLLEDEGGDDTYLARGFAQGAEFLGAGILWDRAGDDDYFVDSTVARDPVAHLSAVAWEELSKGQWRIKARDGEGAEVCNISPPTARGPADGVALQVIDGVTAQASLAYSLFDQARGVWRLQSVVVGLDPCTSSAPVYVTNQISDQRNVALTSSSFVWEDDRAGDLDLYIRDRGASQDPSNDRPLVAGPGDQTGADMVGNWLTWQSDADGGGASSVHLLNLKTPSLTQRLSPAPAAGEVRQDRHPRISDSFVVWQSRTCNAAAAECGPWGVMIHNRQTGNQALRLCRLEMLGRDLTSPDVAGANIVFQDEVADQILRYAWAPGCAGQPQVLRSTANAPVLDRGDAGLFAWMSTIPPEQTVAERSARPAGSPYYEVMRGALLGTHSSAVSGLVNRGEERFLQGAAFLPGIGLAFDEAGNDHFLAGTHSQGASFEVGSPRTGVGRMADQGQTSALAHGVLVNVDGNDRFTALTYSQGADLGATLRSTVRIPPAAPGIPTIPEAPPPVSVVYGEGNWNTALLLSIRGNNIYTANERSQGFGALAAGVVPGAAPERPNPGGPPSEPAEPDEPDAYADGSVGLLMDFGGVDAYRYVPVNPTVVPLGLLPPGTLQGLCDQAPSDRPDTLILEPGFVYLAHEACDDVAAPETVDDGSNNRIVLQGVSRVDERPDSPPGTYACLDEPPYTCAEECPPASGGARDVQVLCKQVVGGVRIDSPLGDALSSFVTSLAKDLLYVRVSALEAGRDLQGSPTSGGLPGRGVLQFVADVKPRGLAGSEAEVESVEFYLGPRFLGYGVPLGGGRYDLSIDTATDETPDGAGYLVTVRATFRLTRMDGVQSASMGAAEGTLGLVIDNPPRIVAHAVEGSAFFSPHPAVADGVPVPPDITFGLSQDVGGPSAPRGHAVVSVLPVGSEEPVAYLRPGGSGADDSPWPVHSAARVSWDGLAWLGPEPGQPAPPGAYRFRIEAADQLGPTGAGLHADRLVQESDLEVRLDSQAPRDGCILVLDAASGASSACNPTLRINADNAPVKEGASQVSLRFTYDVDSAPAFRRAHLFRAPAGPEGAALPAVAAWTSVPTDGSSAALTLASGERILLAVIIEDAAGNVECLPCTGLVSPAAQGDPDAVRSALAAKLSAAAHPGAAAAAARLDTDIDRPLLILGNGGKPVTVDGQSYDKGSVVRTGPHSDVQISYIVKKTAEDRPPVGRLTWTSIEAVGPGQDPLCFERVYEDIVLERIAGSQPPLYRSTWDDWEGLLTPAVGCAPWPEGSIVWTLDAFDPNGNQASPNFGGMLVLDRTAPQVTPGQDHVAYPDGRLHAMAGDALVVSIAVADPAVPPLSAVPPNLLDATLDVSALVDGDDIAASLAATMQAAAAGGVEPCQTAPPEHPGLVDFLLCYNAGSKSFRARIPFTPVDGLDPDLEEATPIALGYTITDPVGNRAEGAVHVVVGAPELGVQVADLDVGVGTATVRFYTVKPASGILEIGMDPEALAPVDEEPGAGDLHTFRLTGLTPGATYHYRMVATGASGAQEASPLAKFRVPQGVHIVVTDPQPGDILSGLDELRVTAGVSTVPGAQPFVRLTLVRTDGAEADTPLFEGQAVNGAVAMRLVTDALPDGTYELVARAIYADESVETRVTGLLLDNVVPTLALADPAADAVVPESPNQITLRVQDGASGFCAGGLATCLVPLTLRLDGAVVEAPAAFERDARGLGGTVVATLPAGTSLLGTVRVQARLPDIAGNPGTLVGRFFVDPDAPDVRSVMVLYPDGQQAARPGQAIRLLVDASDASGIAAATVNVTALGGGRAVPLQGGANGLRLDLVVPSSMGAGGAKVNVSVQDRVGHVTAAEGIVVVDNAPPTIEATALRVLAPDALGLDVNASEPVRLEVTVLELESDRVVLLARSTGHASPATVNLTGLQGGQLYSLRVRAMDRAGQEGQTVLTHRFAPRVVDPTPVTGLVARGTMQGVRLQWDAPADVEALRFRVMRAPEDSAAALEPLGETTATSYLDEGAAPGTRYRYTVETLNLAGAAALASAPVVAVAGGGIAIDPSVSPAVGLADDTVFHFRATLQQARDEKPRAWLVLDDATYAMRWAGGDCRVECHFTADLRLPALDLRHPEVRYAVEVLDGGELVRGPTDNRTLVGPDVLQPAHDARGSGPLRGVPSLGLAPSVLLLALAGLLRRRPF